MMSYPFPVCTQRQRDAAAAATTAASSSSSSSLAAATAAAAAAARPLEQGSDAPVALTAEALRFEARAIRKDVDACRLALLAEAQVRLLVHARVSTPDKTGR
jgi:hypothetical protein